MRYRAFISYSQQDKALAKGLHKALESYRVPRGAAVAIGPDRKLGRFCRDEEEMGAAADIAASVRGAIEDAESLIVLCSPRSAKSQWVNAEIVHFRKTARAGRVFAVILDGTPNATKPEDECFPPALRVAADPANRGLMPIEPLALDLRKDGRTRTIVRLAAGLLAVDFDDLWRRDRRRAAARRTQIGTGAVVVLLGFGALGAWAVREQSVAHSRQLAQASITQVDASGGRAIVQMSGRQGVVTLAVFSPDGVRVATTGVDGTARIWDAKTGGQLHVLRGPQDDPATNMLDERQVASIAFSPDGSKVATASMDNTARIFDAGSGEALVQVEGCPGWDPQVSWVSDGTRIVTSGAANGKPGTPWIATASLDGTARLWDGRDGTEVARFVGHEGGVNSVEFSADWTHIVTASSDGTARVWRLPQGDDDPEWAKGLGAPYLLDRPRDVRAGERVVALAEGGSARLVASGTGAEIVSLTGERVHAGAVHNAAFAPDGGRFVTSGADGSARVWRAADGAEVVRLLGHHDRVLDAQFSPDGTRIATASADGTARLWDAHSGVELARLVTPVEAVQFSANGAHVAIINSGAAPAGWDVTWVMGAGDRARAGWPSPRALVCDPVNGQLRGTLRVLTAQDVAAAPMLLGRAGEDVCATA
jgi:WD40 repeat protein